MATLERNRIVRPDGRQIYLVPKKGHLIVCARGCCCGRTDRGNPAVPIEYYKSEYQRRKLRKHVQLTMSGCIGPCPMLNAVQLVFDGRPIWLQSINTEAQVREIYDYLENMLAANGYVPPPASLAPYVFSYYRWDHTNEVHGLPAAFIDVPAGATGEGILYLTHADTDLSGIEVATRQLPADFPQVRAVSLNGIATAEQMATLLALHAAAARVVVVRILGNVESVPGFEILADHARTRGQALVIVSATVGVDPQTTAASTVPAGVLHQVAAYLQAGGPVNIEHCLRFLADHLLMSGFGCEPPRELPEHGIYRPGSANPQTTDDWLARRDPARPTVGVIFYRAHWISGNLDFIDSLISALEQRGANILPVFTTSLKQSNSVPSPQPRPRNWPAAFDYLIDPHDGARLIDVLITTNSHALGGTELGGPELTAQQSTASESPAASPYEILNVPVVQAITAGATSWQWEVSSRGLNPLDTAMNVALPEFDGRIISVPISFKERSSRAGETGVEVSRYVSLADRISRVAGLALKSAKLRRTAHSDKRIAIVLTNSAAKAGRIGNAVGLDAPASLIKLLHALQQAGYHVDSIPPDGDALIHELIDRCAYDEILLTEQQLAQAAAHVPVEQYIHWFQELPARQREQMEQQWGPPPGEAFLHDGALALAGLDLGNVFIALQPPRGYGMDPSAIYHQPDLPATHHYYALYRWLRDEWQADAMIHLGKHGTLEWLPGKGIGLSQDCFPDSFLGDLPLFYPFIVNDPGEGSQAKRRAHAAVVDHLVPPLTTADAYGPLAELTRLVDEYYQVELLDPSKLPLLQQQIWTLIKESHLDEDLKQVLTSDHGHTHEWDEGLTPEGTPLSLASMQGTEVAHVIEELDAYLCDLTGAQIRNGLHILGDCPAGDGLVDMLHAVTRVPNLECPSLRASLAALFGLDLSAMLKNPGERLVDVSAPLLDAADRPLSTGTDVLETLDELSKHLLAMLQCRDFAASAVPSVLSETFREWDELAAQRSAAALDITAALEFVCRTLVPALDRTTDEIANLLNGLEGGYVPSGPSGAPSRGMVHVLPTGRNFYSVDPRALPSNAAWQVGQALAREVVERHLKESGSYPETVGISVWGTSAMRTHGDDVAQIFALLGIRPKWQQESRRIIGIELMSRAELGRPRIDVVVRISGFFRDAFPHLIRLLDEAVELVIAQDEPLDQNFVRKHYLEEIEPALAAGGCEFDVDRQARYRIFGCKPGSYGAGILPLIDERNWSGDADLAEVYVNWGGYAYTADEQGQDARDVFRQRLRGVEVALHNQDNREHDILDSDDYFQFHGGMIATVRALTGRNPRRYFGDTQDPARPVVRDLKSEVQRVFRTRVANPKWLESIRKHGYKGGLELSATVDYLFGFDATADVVDDWMYDELTNAYVRDAQMREFFEKSNPWALHAIAERLLEAEQRGFWADADPISLEALRETLLATETLLELRSESSVESRERGLVR